MRSGARKVEVKVDMTKERFIVQGAKSGKELQDDELTVGGPLRFAEVAELGFGVGNIPSYK